MHIGGTGHKSASPASGTTREASKRFAQSPALRGKAKKSSKQAHRAFTYKLPPEAREEPEPIQHSKYEEEPVKKGKTHYEEDELAEEEKNEI